MKQVLVAVPASEDQRRRFSSIAEANGASETISFLYTEEEAVTKEQVQASSVIFGNVPAKMIEASGKLEYLQLMSAGADPYLVPGVLSGNTVLCNATGAYGKTVSEHAFALTWALLRKLHLYRSAQLRGEWADFGEVGTLTGATVLVVGLGDIGKSYARLVKAMGAKVIGVTRHGGACPEHVDELVATDAVDTVLPRADVILSVMPNTPQSVHYFTAERFRLMKKTAVFLNCGRGSAVDGIVLLHALQAGEIAAAAIDVAEQEPLPPESPLWQQENLIITPHVAGGFHLPVTYSIIVDIFCENLDRWLKGEPLCNVVDMQTGYRKK